MRLYSNEIVFRGHPDKVCDQISDAILDACIVQDKYTRAGIECAGGKGKIFLTGEVTTAACINTRDIVFDVLESVGYSTDFEVIDNIGKQSADISRGVDIGGAGDQGMMFGYACEETPQLLPKALVILQQLCLRYEKVRQVDHRFKPDGKAQITGYYDHKFNLIKIKDFVIAYQNTEEERDKTDAIISGIASAICSTHDIEVERFLINPTGRFEIGGFDGDAGVTGRKIVVDNYHSFANVGGGAFSGKDPTKVDRSAAYKAREIAKQYLKQYELRWCEIQLSYAIGIAEPLAIYITSDLGNHIAPRDLYAECTPARIIADLDLRRPIYMSRAMYGHFID
jgi:S-adenosylmethionine synthetase